MIHKTAVISKKARIGKNVSIGQFTTVHDNVSIGDNSRIDGYCEIGYPTKLAIDKQLVFGQNTLIRSHSVFYEGSVFGNNLVTGHRVTIRENLRAGINLQIGTLSDFQGDCEIGDYVRTHSNVHIGKKSKISNFVWIFPYVVLTNDPHPPSELLVGVTVDEFAVIATMSVILPGVRVGAHSLIAAHSLVNKDVDEGMVVGGSPAKVLCNTEAIKLKEKPDENAYPWPRHFHKGYPDDIVSEWLKRFG